MIRTVFYDEASRYQRISKARAAKLYNAGQPVYLIAHKMRPGMPFSLGMDIQADPKEPRAFDLRVNEFCYYNANCHETGTYAAFYLVSPYKTQAIQSYEPKGKTA